MLPLESDPLPLLSLPRIHCDTPVIKQDSVNGVMRDMYPMDLFYLLLQMNRSNLIIVKARENEKTGLFGKNLSVFDQVYEEQGSIPIVYSD
jgi:hypothetical protein